MTAWLLLFATLVGAVRRVDLFDAFSHGAQDGLQSAVRVIPFLAATMTGLGVLESSGAVEALCQVLAPLTGLMGLPQGTLPMVLLRPLSGSASLALLRDILVKYGPDSRTGLVASAMMGSGETVFYTCALYLSAAGVRKSGYIIPASLAGWLAGCVTAGMFFR